MIQLLELATCMHLTSAVCNLSVSRLADAHSSILCLVWITICLQENAVYVDLVQSMLTIAQTSTLLRLSQALRSFLNTNACH